MIRRIVDFALDKRLLVLAFTVLLIAAGMVAFHLLPVDAYPDKVLKGRVSNIGAILDPTIRTAKVRLEVENPGWMRLGMFVTATFRGRAIETHAAIPATAILHLHDRQWVYLPLGGGHFRRLEVVAGDMLPGKMQEIVSGIQPGAQVVQDALVLQNTVEQ